MDKTTPATVPATSDTTAPTQPKVKMSANLVEAFKRSKKAPRYTLESLRASTELLHEACDKVKLLKGKIKALDVLRAGAFELVKAVIPVGTKFVTNTGTKVNCYTRDSWSLKKTQFEQMLLDAQKANDGVRVALLMEVKQKCITVTIGTKVLEIE